MKVYRLLVLTIVLLDHAVNISGLANNDLICVPIERCSPLLNILLFSTKSQSARNILVRSRCGQQRYRPNVWCESSSVLTDCLTPDMQNGTCVPLSVCEYLSAEEDISDYQCQSSSILAIHVCCPNQAIGVKRITPFPEEKECGYQPIDTRIFGGTEAGIHEFPWMAILQYVSKRGVKQACSGSLINNQYLITAAHCADPRAIREMGYNKLDSVLLGEYDTRNSTDCIRYFGYRECTEKPIKRRIHEVTLHPDWKWPFFDNDIALLRMSTSVPYSDSIKPICLPRIGIIPNDADNFLVSGWGRTEKEKRSSVKMKTVLLYRNCIGKENVHNICAGGDGNDICSGDSGGPLMFGRVIDGEYLLYLGGIASHGLSRCGNGPSVFTYVPMYMDWILATIKG